MISKKPELLKDKDLDQAQGGLLVVDRNLDAVKKDGPKPGQEGFWIPSGTSHLD